MTTPLLFEKITMHQIRIPSLHIPLIIFDTLPLIIVILQIPSKIKGLNILLYNQLQHVLSMTCSLIVVIVITILIILFNIIYLITRFKKKKCNESIISSLLQSIILFYDLIIFRYFSSFIFGFYIDLIIKCFIEKLSKVLLGFTIISAIGYIITMYHHINMTYIIIHIDNKEIVTSSIRYPFDEFSRRYDLYMLTMKIIAGLEYITYILNQSFTNNKEFSDIMHYLPLFFEYCFILLVLYLFINMILYEIFLMGRVEIFLINTKQNLCRIALINLNALLMMLLLFFIDNSLPLSLISGIIIACLILIWTIASIIIMWYKIVLPMLFNGEISIRKFAFIITRGAILHIPSNDNKKISKCLKINPIKLFTSFKIKHFLNCISKQCQICSLFRGNFDNTFSFLHLFRMLLKKNMITKNDEIDCVYSSLLLLLYFRFHNKPYKYYRQYHKLLYRLDKTDYHQIFINYINLLFASFTNINNDKNNISLYLHITSLSSLNEEIHRTLTFIKDFVMLLDEYDQFDYIIRLAADIRTLHKHAQNTLQNIETKNDGDTNEQITKKIKNVYHYNIMIDKFIIEKVLNEPLNSTLPIEPDQLVDYFTSHYTSDSFLMLGVSKSFLYKETISSIIILKSGHSLIEYESRNFSKIIPKKLEKVANEEFISHLRRYDGNKTSNKTFEFVMNNNDNGDTVTYFKYKFDLLHVLCNDSLLVYGFYTHPEQNIMLFEPFYSQFNELTLWRYSDSIQSLLCLSANIIDDAKEMNFYLTFDNIFLSVHEIEKKIIDNNATPNSNTIHNNNDDVLKFEGIFDYNHYTDLLQFLLEKFNRFYTVTNHCHTEELTNAIKKMQSKAGKQIKLTLKQLNEWNQIKVFSIKLSSNKNNNHNDDTFSELDAAISMSIGGMHSSQQMVKIENELPSTSSVADNYSINSLSSNLNQQKNLKHQLITIYQSNGVNSKKTNKFKASFQLIMKIIMIFNAIIILLCISFLIIQIIQLNSFYSINHLYFQFKQLRIHFNHVFLSVYANFCIASPGTDQCKNAYIDYSRRFQISNEETVNEDYYINNFISKELKYKVDTLLTLYNDNEDEIFYYGDAEVQAILSHPIHYNQIIYSNQQLSLKNMNYTFQQGIKNCFNSLQIVLSHPEYTWSHPIYILSYYNNTLDFTNVYNNDLDPTQKELYGLIINFFIYANVFNQGEDLMLYKVDKINMLNKCILLFILGTVFLLNVILFILCLTGFQLAYKLLYSSCVEIIALLSKKEVQTFFENRIENLLIVNKLYAKNPNNLINDIIKAEDSQLKKNKQLLLKQTRSHINVNSIPIQSIAIKKIYCIEKITNFFCFKRKESLDKNKESSIKEIIKPSKKISKYFFFAFFVIYLIFGWFVFDDYIKVLDLASYVQSSYRFENKIYNTIGVTQIMSLLNMSNRDVAREYGYDPDNYNESLLVIRAREIMTYYDIINQLEALDPNNYPKLSTLFTNNSDCQGFITQMNDSDIYDVSKETKLNFTKMHVQICNKMKSLSLPNFAYIYNDIIYRAGSLQNSLENMTLSELEHFNKSDALFDLYTAVLMIFRPLRLYIKSTLLAQRIEIKMSNFIMIIAIFLAVNIVVTIFIFLLIKFILFQKLNWTNTSLISLKQSLLM